MDLLFSVGLYCFYSFFTKFPLLLGTIRDLILKNHSLELDVARTGTAGGVTGNATGARRERWYARKVSVYVFNVMFWFTRDTANPAPALTAIDRASNRPYMGDLRHRGCYSGPAN